MVRSIKRVWPEKRPTFETVFASVYHCAIPGLCEGMCHRYCMGSGSHESPRPQIHRFRPQAPVPLPGVCFLNKTGEAQLNEKRKEKREGDEGVA